MPLLDGGIHLGGIRFILFNIYCAVLFPVALFVFLSRRMAPLRIGIMFFWLCLLVVSWFLSSIGARSINAALLGALRNTQLMIFAFILVLAVRSFDNLRFFVIGILGAVAWNSAVGWVQSLFGNETFMIRNYTALNATHSLGMRGIGDRVLTAFGDPITTGYFQAVGLSMAMGWALATTSRRERFLTYVLVVFAAVPLITSASRGPVIGCIVAVLVLLVFSGKVKKRLFFLVALTAIFLVFIPEIIIKSLWKGENALFSVAIDRFRFALESDRWSFWYNILRWSLDIPFGVGIGNFDYAAPRFISTFYVWMIAKGEYVSGVGAESMYFTQLVEVGWLGFVAFCGLVASALKRSWNVYRCSVRLTSRDDGSIAACLFGAWLCSAICMLPVYGYSNAGIAVLFWALLGFVIALDKLGLQVDGV